MIDVERTSLVGTLRWGALSERVALGWRMSVAVVAILEDMVREAEILTEGVTLGWRVSITDSPI